MGTIVVPVKIMSGQGIEKTGAGALEATNFKGLGLREEHLESFIAANPELILADRTAILIGRQVSNEQKSRADLVALDNDGSIVVIEIKRDMEDCKVRAEKLEMQAIRYAATYSRIRSAEDLADQVYVPYLQKFEPSKIEGKNPEEFAKSEINRVLRSGSGATDFNARQKIILVASDFDKEVLSACAWLRQNGIEISCIRISPFENGEQPLLIIEQVLPTVALEDMITPIAKQIAIESCIATDPDDRKSRTTLPTIATLFEQKLIESGDEVIIKGRPEQVATALNHKQVQFEGITLPWNEWAKRVTGWSAVNIYANVELLKIGKTLDDLRWGK